MGKLQEKMQLLMELKGLSPRTHKTYLFCMRHFVAYFNQPPAALGTDEIRAYLHHLLAERQLSQASVSQHYSALKFFYEMVLDQTWAAGRIPRVKRAKKLPVILSEEEVQRLLNATGNLKHHSLLTTIYSGGLRLTEALHLQPGDLDSQRMLIFVRGGKGQKDRYTLLSQYALGVLRDYWRYYQPAPWLFPGQQADTPLSPSSVQKEFHRVLKRAGITKLASVHTLRHCFATHLLEGGVELPVLQKMLGHTDARTTSLYLHVTRRNLERVVSPMDRWEGMVQPTFSGDERPCDLPSK